MKIKQDVAALTYRMGREVGTPGHEAAKHHIIERLYVLGLRPYLRQTFEADYMYGGQGFCNLLAVAPGSNPELSPVLLGAHYDTCGNIPGADDNAAAVAALLSSAEIILKENLERSVIFALFDAEEPPNFLTTGMGSIRFYDHQRAENIHCAIIMDLVGHDVPAPGLEDLVFVTGMESNQALATVIQNVKLDPDIRILPTLNRYVGDLSDHHVFRENQVPYLFLSCGRWEHYHEPSDTPEKLNYDKIKAVARFLTDLTIAISQVEMDDKFEGYDSSSIEIRFIQKNLTPVFPARGLLPKLETRADIDRLASMMINCLPL